MRGIDLALLVLRLGVAIVIFPHGAQKALGWFGGPGLEPVVTGISRHLGVPLALVYLVVLVEFIGTVAILLGVLTRLFAFGLAIDMTVAAATVHARNGFFMNWTGHQAGEGVEYCLLVITISLALLIGGPGRIALLPRT